jgi:hypothetical protein
MMARELCAGKHCGRRLKTSRTVKGLCLSGKGKLTPQAKVATVTKMKERNETLKKIS